MRKFISVLILIIGLLVMLPDSGQLQASNASDQVSIAESTSNPATTSMQQEELAAQPEPEQTNVDKESGGNFFADNWGVLILGLLGFFDLIARLTPTEKDNSIVNFLMTIFNATIPNLKKGGGSFRLLSK